jgi:hypothetical protein
LHFNVLEEKDKMAKTYKTPYNAAVNMRKKALGGGVSRPTGTLAKKLGNKMKAADTPEGRTRRRDLATGVGKAVKAGLTTAASPEGQRRRQAARVTLRNTTAAKTYRDKAATPEAKTARQGLATGLGKAAKAGLTAASTPEARARRQTGMKSLGKTLKKHRGKLF